MISNNAVQASETPFTLSDFANFDFNFDFNVEVPDRENE